MNFCYQRASGVDHAQLPFLRFGANARRDSMRAEDQYRADRNFLDGFHKDSSAAAPLVYHISVVHNFMMNVDRAAIRFERQFNDIDCAHHACAEPSWPDAHQRLSSVGGALYVG